MPGQSNWEKELFIWVDIFRRTRVHFGKEAWQQAADMKDRVRNQELMSSTRSAKVREN